MVSSFMIHRCVLWAHGESIYIFINTVCRFAICGLLYYSSIQFVADWLIFCKQTIYCYVVVFLKRYRKDWIRLEWEPQYNLISFYYVVHGFKEALPIRCNTRSYTCIFPALTLIQASKLIALTAAYHLIGGNSFPTQHCVCVPVPLSAVTLSVIDKTLMEGSKCGGSWLLASNVCMQLLACGFVRNSYYKLL